MDHEPASSDTTSPAPRPARSHSRRLATIALAAGLMIVGVWYANRPSTVSGVVTLDDKPLTTGLVSFHPVAAGPIAYGRIDERGGYEIRTGGSGGLAPGEYLVTVAANEPPAHPPAPTPEIRESLPRPLITPEKYAAKETSGLRVTVRSGKNEFDFNLRK